MQESAIDNATRYFVHELDALQRQQDGRDTLEEIVEAIARTDITAAGVAEVLRRNHHDGIDSTSTAPNPANYNRPLLLPCLNREHPLVRAGLAGDPLPQTPVRTERRTDIKFPIGTITGEPLSERIIRERR